MTNDNASKTGVWVAVAIAAALAVGYYFYQGQSAEEAGSTAVSSVPAPQDAEPAAGSPTPAMDAAPATNTTEGQQ